MPSSRVLRPYVSDLLLRRLAARPAGALAPDEERPSGAVLFVDVTGFTALTEQLAQRGPSGAELLTDILNDCFGTVIAVVLEHGGDVAQFAGDAVLAVWPDDDPRRAALRAARCGWALQEALERRPSREEVRLRARAGVGVGGFWSGCVGGARGRWEHLVAGEAAAVAGRAATRAVPGGLVVTSALGDLVRDTVTVRAAGDGFLEVLGVAAAAADPAPASRFAADPDVEHLSAFVPRAIVERLAAGHTGWEAEFRRITVLFVGARDLDYAAADALARVHAALGAVQEVVYRMDGSVHQIVADQSGTTVVLAAWGLPMHTHEDDAARAVAAALAALPALRAAGVRASAGLATGRVFCGIRGDARRCEYAMLGDTVNTAARLMQAADGGVLCDAATATAGASRRRFEALTPLTLKGKQQPVPVFRPAEGDDAGPAGERADGALVGREGERATLAERLTALREKGAGGVILVEGDPGIGKSRLVDWARRFAEEHGLRQLRGEADAVEQSTAYYAWRRVLRDLLAPAGDGTDIGEAVLASLAGAPDLIERAALLGAVLPLDLPETAATRQLESQGRADGVHDLIAHLLTQATAAIPTMLVLEDAHWLDSASLALAAALARRVPRLLLLVTTRPLGEPLTPDQSLLVREAGRARLTLTALSRGDAVTLVAHRLGVRELPAQVGAFIAARAEGNPFFCEQLAYALRDAGHLVIEGDRCAVAADVTDLAALGVPTTVEGVVAGRIDRLGPREQLTIKVASAIGRSFGFRLLHDVHPVEGDRLSLPGQLASLVRLDLTVVERPEPEPSWLFTHAITQDVAYGMLVYAQRRALHRAIAEWLERSAAADPAPYFPLLAFHWSRAEVTDRALAYLERAGQQALERHANEEAARFFGEALAVQARTGHDAGDAARARWSWGRGTALLKLSRYAESRPHLLEALRLWGRPAPRTTAGQVLDIVRQVLVQAAHRAWPSRLLGRRWAERDVLLPVVDAQRSLTEVAYWRNDFVGLVHANLVGLNLAESAGESKELVLALATFAFLNGLMTLHGVARSYRRLTDEVGARVGSLDALAFHAEVVSVYQLCMGDWPAAHEAAARGTELFGRIGDRMRWHTCFSLHGYAHLHQGRLDLGRPFFEEGLAAVGPDGALQAQLWSLCGLLATDLAQDRSDPAIIERVADLVEKDLHHSDVILACGLLATTRHREGRHAEAQRYCARATPLIDRFPPASWHTMLGTAAVAELHLADWEARGDAADRALRRRAGHAVAGLWRFSRSCFFARPRAHLLRGRAAALAGDAGRAERLWERGVALAQRLDMGLERGLLHAALAALSTRGPERRADDRALARRYLEEAGARYALARLDAVNAG